MSDVVVCESRHSFDDTVATLQKTIETGGGTVFVAIDQSAAAKTSALELRPTTLIVFGNPKSGTPLMEAFPLAGLELPLKLLVWQERDRVSVAYVPVATIAKRYDITGKDALLAAMTSAIEALVATVAELR